jgi:hypothetical protein
MKDGRDVLDRLASHPATARFVCGKLIRRFVTDTPTASLVASAAQVFRQNWQAPNQIELVLRHILNSTAMFNTWGQKMRRPFEALVGAMRAGGSDWAGSSSMGMTWKMLNWLTEANDNGTTLMPIVQLTRANVPVWTANALVDYWCMRLLGYLPAPERRQTLAGFMAQNADPATTRIDDTDAWAANDLKKHYNHQRLRSMVTLILLSPEFMSR